MIRDVDQPARIEEQVYAEVWVRRIDLDDAVLSLRLRFEDDVRIRVGGSARALEHRHAMRGLRPVVLNGMPLLEITDPQQASRQCERETKTR